MISRILYPTDFSEHARKCLQFLLRMKDCGVQEIVLLHVIDDAVIRSTLEVFDGTIDLDRVVEESRREAERRLGELSGELKRAGLNVRQIVREGVPFSTIMKVADEVDATLVLIGHKGHNPAEELLLGSVAEKVARKCKRPVLLVR